jgi:hypothetical protein
MRQDYSSQMSDIDMSGGLRVTSLQKSIALRVASRHCRQARPDQLTAFRIWGNQKATFWISHLLLPKFHQPKAISLY